MTDFNDQSLPMRTRMTLYIKHLQQDLISQFESIDPTYKFHQDSWIRPQGGEGISSVLSDSRLSDPFLANSKDLSPSVLEKGGINISIVHGKLPPPAIAQMKANHSTIPYDPNSKTSLPYFAAGISIVLHPRNPYAPTIHANYRYFELTEEPTNPEDTSPKVLAWWFGGGSDLTPSYLFKEDAVHFHKTIQEACAPSGSFVYPAFKKWCDEYFHLPHRGEARGIGGIFFDDLSDEDHAKLPGAVKPGEGQSVEGASVQRPWTQEEIFAHVRRCAESFGPSYIPILLKRKDTPYGEPQRRWQLIRRGRYVEFNLVFDRGTKFGLQTPGVRIESVLMSLPETARWEYHTELGTEEGTPEYDLLEMVKKGGTDWLGIE